MKNLLIKLTAIFMLASCSTRESISELDRLLQAAIPDAMAQIGSVEGFKGYTARYDMNLSQASTDQAVGSVLERLYINGNTYKFISVTIINGTLTDPATGEQITHSNELLGKTAIEGTFTVTPRQAFLDVNKDTLDKPLGTRFAEASSYPSIRVDTATKTQIFNARTSTWGASVQSPLTFLQTDTVNNEFTLVRTTYSSANKAYLVLDETATYKAF